jgi:hypothetical protein
LSDFVSEVKAATWRDQPVKSSKYESVAASLLGKRRSIQLSSVQPPSGQVLVHDREEAIVMIPLDKMDEFVNNDILEAFFRLLNRV